MTWQIGASCVLGATAAMALASAGCSDGAVGEKGGDGTAALAVVVSGPDFTGNSVHIVGTRGAVADGKYPCASGIDVCLVFDAQGKVPPVEDLCPSEDIPTGQWNFTYEVWSDTTCGHSGGSLLNGDGNPHNFACFDSQDLLDRAYPNETYSEPLHPGSNTNDIVCLTTNATKTWDFNSCSIVKDDPPTPFDGGILELDCGCVPVSGTCSCAQNLTNLEDGCTFDPVTCHVVCEGEPIPPPDCSHGDPSVAYNALPFDVVNCTNPSLGFQAQRVNEFGDEVQLAGSGTVLKQLKVVFPSFACQSGHWNTGDCVSAPGATFTHPVTANIYDPGNLSVPIATVTQLLTFPYRPSADPVHCTGADAGKWFNFAAGVCQNQISTVQTFNLPAAAVPAGRVVIWTVAYNTSNAGYSPLAPQPCNSDPAGCPYDSLNVGAMTQPNSPYAGIDVVQDEAWLSNQSNPALHVDTGWSPNRPEGEVITN